MSSRPKDLGSVGECLRESNPLTKEVALFLSNYKEEDDLVDYKQTINIASEKSWLEIVKDISSFANTHGGYLVFGITDNEHELVGLSRDVADAIKNVNMLHQKINRYLEPNISSLRAAEYKVDSSNIVVLYIPQSKGLTHLIKKDGNFQQPSGKPKTILHQGTFYIRRSAANHLGDARDLDSLIERRIDQFRDALIDKVAKVVRSPAKSDVFILSKDPSDPEAKSFVIEDSPDSVAIKGMSFTIAPEGFEQEIAAWSVLTKGKTESIPSAATVWRWYAARKIIQVSESHKLHLFQMSLWNNVPSFYWIQNVKAAQVRETLMESIRIRPNNLGVNEMLIVAAFLGKGAYSKALSTLGGYSDKISPAMKAFPSNDIRTSFGTFVKAKKQQLSVFNAEKLIELDVIAKAVEKTGKPPALNRRWEAVKIDRFLYANDNQYK